MISLDSLIQPVTSDQVFDKLLDVLELVNIPARSWRPGGVARSILGGVAQLGAQGASIVTASIAGGFLLLGKGPYLTAHAKDVYGVDRIAATFATGTVVLTNSGGSIRTFGPDELIVRSSATKARFRISVGFTLGANTTSDPLDVSAIEPGSASSVAPGEIDELDTPLARITVTNFAAIVGLDDESDDALVQRCLAKRGTWSPLGPRDAYAFAALSATLPSGDTTSITRVAVSPGSSIFEVRIVCATPTGAPSSDELDAVRAAIEKMARPDTAKAIVEAAVPVATAHSIILWCRGADKQTVLARAQAAMSTFIAGYRIGGVAKTDGGQGYLYSDAISGAVLGDLRILGQIEAYDLDFVGVGGAADIPLEPNEVATNTTTFDVRITS